MSHTVQHDYHTHMLYYYANATIYTMDVEFFHNTAYFANHHTHIVLVVFLANDYFQLALMSHCMEFYYKNSQILAMIACHTVFHTSLLFQFENS